MRKITKTVRGHAFDWYSETDLLKLFPHAREIIPKKISEYKEVIIDLEKEISTQINLINNATTDEFTLWFCKEIIAMEHISTLLSYDRHLSRLSRQWAFLNPNNKNMYNHNFQEKIEYAKSVPINAIVSRFIELKKVGNDHIGKCPFHDDKNPSLRCYANGNNFYCFGCHEGGSTIDFVMKIQGCSFGEAIKFLQN